MRDVLQVAAEWARRRTPFAVATVAGVRGSAPRELGASMIVSHGGVIFGTVSGGCVDGAVFEECRAAIDAGTSSLHSFGISDDEVTGVGLTCGGEIDVLVWPVLPDTAAARTVLLLGAHEQERHAAALVLSLRGRDAEAHPVVVADAPAPTDPALADAASLAGDDRARLLHYDADGCPAEATAATRSVLVVPFGAPPRLIVVGAVEFAVALSRLAQTIGYRVTVVDPRAAFATAARFPGAQIVTGWPDRYLADTEIDERTAICVLSHDPRFDVPALRIALTGPAGYVGAMGSRRTHEERLRRLADAGMPASALARLRSPIGLDLGGRSADETALSILAEIVAVRHGASGRPLTGLRGDVHAPLRDDAHPAEPARPQRALPSPPR
ncbi:MAG: XdhC family protein [Microbacterium sp.]